MKCEDCKFIRKLEHNFKIGKGYENSYCCILFTQIEDCQGGVVEVEPYSRCEMFTRKEKQE